METSALSRRTEIADAAIKTLAKEGMRGFTHRAVDRTAGLPQGSTSYYYRTRAALLDALVQRLVELDELELPEQLKDVEDAVGHMAGLLISWATDNRDRQIARYELLLESTRRPELRPPLDRARKQVQLMLAARLRGVIGPAAEDVVRQLTAPLDGLLMYHATLAVPPDHDQLAGQLRGLIEWAIDYQRPNAPSPQAPEAP
ncbi:TetR/AcrR family transcriptional regulator [Arthrobacter celericrescens]|uniref:TetR/AcrR family transcriptional regulator n=1 Tax=Arthrobacter celericrescens TaxID=2320851 RepID=UPI000EA00E75|nr:TetR family transcriptional regulator [Arthrobacter celericrescens]